MKKPLLLLLAVTISMTFYIPVSANSASSGTCGDNLTWNITGGVLTISGTGDMYNYLYSLYNPPWYDNTNPYNQVVVSEGVTSIGEDAFWGVYDRPIKLPDSLRRIGVRAFVACDLSKIEIKHGVTTIDSFAFWGCSGTSFVLPDSVTTLSNNVFTDCGQLASLTIPESVTSIGTQAFSNCPTLKLRVKENSYAYSYAISNSVNYTIYAEGTCGDNLKWDLTDGILTISGTGDMYDYDAGNLPQWSLKKQQIKQIVICDGVTSIGDEAFSDCVNLTDVSIPSSVTRIGGAFSGCTALTSINIPSSVIRIESYAFNDCTGLTSLTIPENITYIGYAFKGCTNLKTLYFNAVNCTEMGSWTNGNYPAFSDCINLKEVSIGVKVTNIPNKAFYNCSGLTTVKIPSSVTSIGSYVFYGCPNMALKVFDNSYAKQYAINNSLPYSLYVAGTCSNTATWEIDNDVLTISGTGALADHMGFWSGDYPSWYNSMPFSKVVINEGITYIGSNSFSDMSGISVQIPSSVNEIGIRAFSCSNITEITIKNGVTKISAHAFDTCVCPSIVLPDSVMQIGEMAFASCVGLTSVTIPDSVSSIGDQGLLGVTRVNVVKNSFAYGYAINNSLNYTSINAYDDCYIDGTSLIKFKDGPDYLIKSYYDENGKLIGFNSTELNEAGRIPLTYERKGIKVKMMVWQSLGNIKPMTDVSEYNIN